MKLGQSTGSPTGAKCAGCSWVVPQRRKFAPESRERFEHLGCPRADSHHDLVEAQVTRVRHHPDAGGQQPQPGRRGVVPHLRSGGSRLPLQCGDGPVGMDPAGRRMVQHHGVEPDGGPAQPGLRGAQQ